MGEKSSATPAGMLNAKIHEKPQLHNKLPYGADRLQLSSKLATTGSSALRCSAKTIATDRGKLCG
jgi:hypothetical protein